MKLARVSTIVAAAFAIGTGAVLFITSQQVQRAEHRLVLLQVQKIKEQDSIHVLRAEWDYLNRPDRLEALAAQYLGMQAPLVQAVTSDPQALTAPIEIAAPAGHKAPRSLTQAVVYKAQMVAASPGPAAAQVHAHDTQHDFGNLIHSLSGDDSQ